MADVDTGDIVRVGAGLIYDGLYDVVNVWNLLMETDVGRTWAQAESAIQAWLDAVYDELKATLSVDIGTGPVSLANETQSTVAGTVAWSPTWGGAAAGDPTASGVCLFAWGRTYKSRVQIRKYFGVFAESNVADGSFVTAAREDAQSAMDIAIATGARGSFTNVQAVAYNRTLGTYNISHSADTKAEPAYQRRRKRGRGS